MRGEDIFSALFGIAVIAYLFGFFEDTARYQVANNGSSQAIVLDTKTGEAWFSETKKNQYGGDVLILRPLPYVEKQSEYKGYLFYTPEETRIKSNSSWWVYIKKMISE